VIALGGGGYDLPNVARAWTAAWAAINGVTLAPELPKAAHAEMRRLGLGCMSLWDPPVELPPEARQPAEEYSRRQVASVREKIFPLHGL
jgi:acetoin utilization protein AcuC